LLKIRQLIRIMVVEPTVRRQTMFGTVGLAVAMVAIGAFLAWEGLAASPFLFLLYWGLCAWLAITALLIAIFDLLIVFRAGRRARKDLARQLAGADQQRRSRESNIDPDKKDR